MRNTSLRLLVGSALLSAALAGSAGAQVIANTGQGAQGTLDPNWSQPFGQARIISDGNLPGTAWATSPTSRWISMNDSPYQPTGTFNYSTTFDLTGFDISTAILSGQWTVDDYATLMLNGNVLGTQSGQWSFFTAFTVNGGSGFFTSGVNTLTVSLTQADGYFDALNVDQLSITADAVSTTPEPASIALVATGLVGMFGVARRRRMV